MLVVSIVAMLLFGTLNTSCIRGGSNGDKPNNQDGDQPVVTAETTLDHLIIEEVFAVGTLYETRKLGKKKFAVPYDEFANDQFIKLHNPTKEVKYLDGLGIALSLFEPQNSVLLDEEDLKLKDKVLGTVTVLQFPGNGKEYAIQPGGSVLIAAQAINHKAGGMSDSLEEPIKAPAKALDLSNATFQWIPQSLWDEDNKFNEVGNASDMKLVYDKDKRERISLPLYGMIALIDLSVAGRVEQIDSDESNWKFVSMLVSGSHGHGTTYECKKVPNDWVIDAVSMCPMLNVAWTVASKELDAGNAHTLEATLQKNAFKEEHFSKSIRRKHNGKSFEDTNDSTRDFTAGDVSLLAK